MRKQHSIYFYFSLYLIFIAYVHFIYRQKLDFSWIVKGGWETLWLVSQDRNNFRLFATIWRYLQSMNYATGMRIVLENIGFHILMFMPFGYFLPRIRPAFQKWFYFLLMCFIVFLVKELLQWISLSGGFDVDDIVLDLLGATMGFLFLRNPDKL